MVFELNEIRLRVKGIFFDLDGTIVDTREVYFEAARAAFEYVGQDPPKMATALEIPRRLEQKLSIRDLVKGDSRVFLDTYLRAFCSIAERKTKSIPEVSSTLKLLSERAQLGLITMRFVSREAIIRELKRFKIAQYFVHVVTGSDSLGPKPAPDALIQCQRVFDIKMCDCVIVGDSISDIRAGKAAGAKTVAVLSGLYSRQELAEENPDLILENVNWLPNFLE